MFAREKEREIEIETERERERDTDRKRQREGNFFLGGGQGVRRYRNCYQIESLHYQELDFVNFFC